MNRMQYLWKMGGWLPFSRICAPTATGSNLHGKSSSRWTISTSISAKLIAPLRIKTRIWILKKILMEVLMTNKMTWKLLKTHSKTALCLWTRKNYRETCKTYAMLGITFRFIRAIFCIRHWTSLISIRRMPNLTSTSFTSLWNRRNRTSEFYTNLQSRVSGITRTGSYTVSYRGRIS